MRARRSPLAATVLAVLTAGCATQPTFTTGYRVERALLRPTPLRGGLAVRRFEEARPPRLYTTNGRMFLVYVPVIPYVALPYERLDETIPIQTDYIRTEKPSETNLAPPFEQYAYVDSMPRAIAEDLAGSGLFDDVRFVGDGPTQASRYVLSGSLRATPIEQDGTSYGLGFVGVYFWLLPIPLGKMWAASEADLTLTDSTDGTVVWHHTVRGEVSRVLMLYTARGMRYGPHLMSMDMVYVPSDAQVDRDSIFAWNFEALRRGMQEAKTDLAHTLEAR